MFGNKKLKEKIEKLNEVVTDLNYRVTRFENKASRMDERTSEAREDHSRLKQALSERDCRIAMLESDLEFLIKRAAKFKKGDAVIVKPGRYSDTEMVATIAKVYINGNNIGYDLHDKGSVFESEILEKCKCKKKKGK